MIPIGCSQETGSEVADQKEKSEVKKIKIAEIEKRRINHPEMVEADILPSKKADIIAEVDGVVEKKYIRVGEEVKERQKLLDLGKEDYKVAIEKARVARSKAVVQLETAKNEWKTNVISAENSLKKAQRHLGAVKDEYQRKNALFEAHAISKVELEQVEDKLETAKLDLKLAEQKANSTKSEANLELLELQAKEAELSYQEASIQLRKTTLTAPINGIVVDVVPHIGEHVTPGTKVAQIEDHTPLYLEGFITEQDYTKLKYKETLLVQIPVLEREIEGSVMYVSPSSINETAGFKVSVAIENQEKHIRPGMTAQFIINDEELKEVVVAPIASILEEDGRYYTYIVDGQKAKKVFVEIGLETKHYVEVVRGLEVGQHVVIVGQSLLEDGDNIEVIE